jgi:hypothetical protein
MTKHRKYKGGSAQSAMEHRIELNKEHNRMIQSGGKFFNPPFQENGGSSTTTATQLEQTKMQSATYSVGDGNAGQSQPAPVPTKGGGSKRKSRKLRKGRKERKERKERKRRTRRNKTSKKHRSRK